MAAMFQVSALNGSGKSASMLAGTGPFLASIDAHAAPAAVAVVSVAEVLASRLEIVTSPRAVGHREVIANTPDTLRAVLRVELIAGDRETP